MVRRPSLPELLALAEFTRQLDAIRERFQAERLDQRREAGVRQARRLDAYAREPQAFEADGVSAGPRLLEWPGLPP